MNICSVNRQPILSLQVLNMNYTFKWAFPGFCIVKWGAVNLSKVSAQAAFALNDKLVIDNIFLWNKCLKQASEQYLINC